MRPNRFIVLSADVGGRTQPVTATKTGNRNAAYIDQSFSGVPKCIFTVS